MAVTLYMLKGLPASGKTTWAKRFVLESPNAYKRVNKDDLRNMLDAGHWSRGNEKFVLRVRNLLIREALASGKHVISDDTNLHPKHEQQLKSIAKEYDAKFEIVDRFLGTSPEECIKRDLKRENSVGSDVIMSMYNQFLKPPAAIYEPPVGKPEAIIVDIDGTLAHNQSGRSYYDWSRVHEDTVDETIRNLIDKEIYFDDTYPDGPPPKMLVLLVVSGRDGSCYDKTRQWLIDNDIPFSKLYMREAGDMRPDYIIKKEIFDNSIRDHYKIKYVLDDRDQTVQMWREEIGLKTLQVAEGNF